MGESELEQGLDEYLGALTTMVERGREEIKQGRFARVASPEDEAALFERVTGRPCAGTPSKARTPASGA